MVFFDLDGTLVDHDNAVKHAVVSVLNEYSIDSELNEEEIYNIWNHILEENYNLYLQGKITHSEQRINRFKDFYNYFNYPISDEQSKSLLQTYLREYEKNWKIYTDVMNCLKNLGNHRLGIISNGYLEQQIKKLKRTGIKEYFEIVVTSSEIGLAKPHREIFEIACKQAGVPMNGSVYIGDRLETDGIGSRDAGMQSFWLKRDRKDEKKIEGINIIHSLEELEF
jgi:putative hydrolase of the HAD superfamily